MHEYKVRFSIGGVEQFSGHFPAGCPRIAVNKALRYAEERGLLRPSCQPFAVDCSDLGRLPTLAERDKLMAAHYKQQQQPAGACAPADADSIIGGRDHA